MMFVVSYLSFFLFLSELAFSAQAAGECSGCVNYCEGLANGIGTTSTQCILGTCQCVCTNGIVHYSIKDRCGCFSSETTADVKGKGKIPMDEIHVGDQVLTSSGNYEPIYSIDHRHPTKSSNFVQIHVHEQQEGPLELTPQHMVFLEGNPNPVPAHSVKVGDELQTFYGNTNPSSTVTKIDSITRKGLFSPLTTSGTIVVNNGIVASSYSALLSDNEWIEIAGMKIMTHQNFFNMALKPYKYLCTGVSLELCKTNKERVSYSQFGTNLYIHWQQEENSDIYKIVTLSLAILFLYLFDFMLSPYGLILTVSSIVGYVMMTRSFKSKKLI